MHEQIECPISKPRMTISSFDASDKQQQWPESSADRSSATSSIEDDGTRDEAWLLLWLVAHGTRD